MRKIHSPVTKGPLNEVFLKKKNDMGGLKNMGFYYTGSHGKIYFTEKTSFVIDEWIFIIFGDIEILQ